MLIAIRNTLSSSLICHDTKLELTWVCVHNFGLKEILGICYRPPDSDSSFCDSLHDALTTIKNTYLNSNIFLFGDFNYPHINWASLSVSSHSPSKESKQFLDLTLDFNLHQTITHPTRGTHTLDLLLTSCPDNIHSVTLLPGLSDHMFLHICTSLHSNRRSPTKKLITDYKRGNFDSINKELSFFFTDFLGSYLTNTVHENWESYKSTMLRLKNKYIPTIVVKSDSNNIWFNKNLKHLLSRKKRLYRSAKLSQKQEAWERYHACASKYLNELSAAKDKFFSVDLLSILKTNPTKFWRILSPKHKSNRFDLVGPDGEPADTNQCAKLLNDYFSSVFSPVSNSTPNVLQTNSQKEMPEIQISPEGISKLISSLKLSSSAGCDQINSKLLKNTLSLSSQILHLIFTQSLDTGNIPDDWKIAQIVPIFKTGDRACPANYRPISLTSISSKLLEHIISSSLMSHLDSINFFYPHQHGFRKSFSCETQLAEFTQDILKAIDDNLQIDAIFLDFSKAFDRVPHNHLLAKLSFLGIPANLICWLEHFLKGRSQFTSANNIQSPLTDVTSGVPQGAGLSPLLFLIYINDLPSNIQCKLRLFADDCVIYNAISNPTDNLTLQLDLDVIASWCEKWQMPLNLTKCKSLSFTHKHTLTNHTYSISSVPITVAKSYKYLGVHLTSTLSWVTHIRTICSDTSRTLGYLRRNLKSASPNIKQLAYETFVRPKLEYASSIWHPWQSYLTIELESIQNRAARFITSCYSREASVTALKQSLRLSTLESRRVVSRLCLLHTFYHNTRSRHALLTAPLRTSSRLSHGNPIARISGHTSAYNNSFFPNAIALWNSLPNDIAACTDHKTFREKIKIHLT